MAGLCPHFNDCGGCDSQDKDYSEQLRLKEHSLKNIFSSVEVGRVENIVPSPEIWHYRNKMEYVVGPVGGSPAIGLRRKHKFYKIINLSECRIFHKDVQNIFSIFKVWMNDHSIEPYHLTRHTGTLRYVALRHSKFYDEMMVTVVAAQSPERFRDDKDKYAALVDALKKIANIKSIYVSINNGVADIATAETIFPIYGEEYIRERINDVDYLISPSTFFQTNSLCCAKLYEAISNQAAGRAGRRAIDLYCGSGGISLQISKYFEKVTAIDVSEKNISDGVKNAGINGIGNVEFISSAAEKFLSDANAAGGLSDYSVIVVDPPRAGLGKKARAVISGAGIENLIYVSCNPESLKEDLSALAALYRIERLIPVDMFPHTRHMETVAILKKGNIS